MMRNIHWHGHSSFRLQTQAGLVLYIDPWRLSRDNPKADLVLITHPHHDHCSPDDVAALSKPDTVIAGPAGIAAALARKTVALAPGEKTALCGIAVETVPAYNIGRPFHPAQAGNLGFIVTVDGTRVYHAGDTDLIPEMKTLKTDMALLPIGGTYTMDPQEAAQAAALLGPAAAVPMHYGKHVGAYALAQDFLKLAVTPVTILPEEK
ncbi:MAG: MBL fold metallo-hydrolase [Elusimicrobiaceae bacterium]|nr:MBL fold metallo-hydrolase [Elusimicrobiaceae bacterium]